MQDGLFVSPAIARQSHSCMERSSSLSRLPVLDTAPSLTTTDDWIHDDSAHHISRAGRAHSSDRQESCLIPYSNNDASVAETLVTILLRTWRCRPGTLGLRLFTRTCCLLALLCEALPPDVLLSHSLLSIFCQLSDCLHRRSICSTSSSIQLPNSRSDAVDHSATLLELSSERRARQLSVLRCSLR
ncbi:unnamed protein product [Dicrocoelium dendriticum]|nr:unnamed protein product [Dicrocoelium dendriticum]